MEENHKTFGQKLQTLRKQNSLSQETLAKLLYVTRQSISLWENDKAMPSIDLLMRLGSIFSVSVDELLDNPTPQTEKPFSKHTTLYSKELLYDAFRNESYILRTLIACVAVIYALLGILLLSGIVNVPGADVSPIFSLIPVMTGLFGIFISVGLILLLIVLNIRMKSKVDKLVSKTKVEILTFKHNMRISEYGNQTINKTIPYSQIEKIYETENYYIIYLVDKNIVVADKNNAQGDVGYLQKIASLYHRHKKRFVYPSVLENRKTILLTKYSSIILCVASVISLWVSLLIAMIPLSAGKVFSELTAFEGGFVKFTMLGFLLIPLSSLIFGLYNKSKGRRTKLNIIIGIVMLAIMGLYSLMFIMLI